MTQTRLFFTAGRQAAEAIFPALEAAFEESGLPLAMIDIEEHEERREISIYVDGDTAEAERTIAEILAGQHHAGGIEQEELPDIDWVARSLEALKPVRAGRFFVHGSHDRHRRRIGDIAIEIEAGLAFGTGHHGTTAGCLESIEKVLRRERPRNALDLGTGSAVLAIAIAGMARIPVLATDIDPVATRVASENARLNGVSALVHTATAPGFHHPLFKRRGPFDLIVANILARPLMRLAPAMAAHLAPGGSLVLSGILERQRDAVVAAYSAQHFRHVRTLAREGWVTLHLKR